MYKLEFLNKRYKLRSYEFYEYPPQNLIARKGRSNQVKHKTLQIV